MQAKRRLSVAAIFPLIVLGYVLIQVYAAWKAHAWLDFSSLEIAAVTLWIVLMTFSLPLLVRLEHKGSHRLATVTAWVGFGWMGWVFLFFWIALVLDAIGLAVSAADADVPAGFPVSASTLRSFPVAGLAAFAVAVYGFIDARRVRVERVMLRSVRLPPGSRGIRLALISDVHLGVLVGARRLRRLIDRIRTLDADILVSVGDLVDGIEDRLRELAPIFDALRPRYGKFAVTGNHEYYAGITHALDFHRRAGFVVLRGEAVEVGEGIRIVGVDDPTGRSGHADEAAVLKELPHDRFTVLLKHQPVLNPAVASRFDLQLSGHVHRGQIFPFGWLVRLVYPVRTGLTQLSHDSWLYVSRGTGTWGPPMRVGAPPEITLVEIAPAS